jgi:hypothetical protein
MRLLFRALAALAFLSAPLLAQEPPNPADDAVYQAPEGQAPPVRRWTTSPTTRSTRRSRSATRRATRTALISGSRIA